MTTENLNNNTHNTEDFAEMFEQFIQDERKEGTVAKGRIILISDKEVVVDVGLKSEGRISTKEFGTDLNNLKVGDQIDVYIERMEDRYGNTVLSRDKALREEAWFKFEELYKKKVHVEGKIIGRVKGGMAVDLDGIIAFLPGSQLDIRPVKDLTPLIGIIQPFEILKMDRRQGNIVVSRRAILEATRAEARDSLLLNLKEGDVLTGTVKNITDYGAFIDLGSLDGLVHITDLSWKKITHPSEILSVGQQVKVMIIKYNEETKRVSLGLKQLEKNPWEGLVEKYQVGMRTQAVITSVRDFGAVAELEPNVEGLVYHTEISWNARNIHPRKLVKPGDKIEVVILEMDITKHKISLSMKQCFDNPWKKFAERHPIGSEVEGIVQNIADFGMFVQLNSDKPEEVIEALVPVVEISWNESPEEEIKKYKKGDAVKTAVMAIDPERERITLSLRQLSKDVFVQALQKLNKGDVVTCAVTDVRKDGIEVEVIEGIKVFIKKGDLSKHKSEQRPERFGVGDKVDALIITLEPGERKVTVSIKALEVEEEKRAIAEYGSKNSGASLGEILGMALSNKENQDKKAKEEAADGQ